MSPHIHDHVTSATWQPTTSGTYNQVDCQCVVTIVALHGYTSLVKTQLQGLSSLLQCGGQLANGNGIEQERGCNLVLVGPSQAFRPAQGRPVVVMVLLLYIPMRGRVELYPHKPRVIVAVPHTTT